MQNTWVLSPAAQQRRLTRSLETQAAIAGMAEGRRIAEQAGGPPGGPLPMAGAPGAMAGLPPAPAALPPPPGALSLSAGGGMGLPAAPMDMGPLPPAPMPVGGSAPMPAMPSAMSPAPQRLAEGGMVGVGNGGNFPLPSSFSSDTTETSAPSGVIPAEQLVERFLTDRMAKGVIPDTAGVGQTVAGGAEQAAPAMDYGAMAPPAPAAFLRWVERQTPDTQPDGLARTLVEAYRQHPEQVNAIWMAVREMAKLGDDELPPEVAAMTGVRRREPASARKG